MSISRVSGAFAATLTAVLCAWSPSAEAAPSKVAILHPGDGFTTDGSLAVGVRVRKATHKKIAKGSRTITLAAEVEGCDTQTFTLDKESLALATKQGLLVGIELNKKGKPKAYQWTVNVPLAECQCLGLKTIHHCPATGSAFDTHAGDDKCDEKAVHLETKLLFGKKDRNMCLKDLDQDGTGECAVVDGSLLPAETEKWVGNWDGGECKQRSQGKDQSAPKGGKQ